MTERLHSDARLDLVVHDHLVESLARNLTARREAETAQSKRMAKRDGILLVSMALGRHLDPYQLMREARTLLHDREIREKPPER